MRAIKYAVCTRPGCYGGPDTTIHSVHRTHKAAARRLNSRRVIVEFAADAEWAVPGYKFPLRLHRQPQKDAQ